MPPATPASPPPRPRPTPPTSRPQSRQQAAQIYADAYSLDPALYKLLRSLDTIGAVVGPNTRLILRTDAAPFHVLVDGAPKP